MTIIIIIVALHWYLLFLFFFFITPFFPRLLLTTLSCVPYGPTWTVHCFLSCRNKLCEHYILEKPSPPPRSACSQVVTHSPPAPISRKRKTAAIQPQRSRWLPLTASAPAWHIRYPRRKACCVCKITVAKCSLMCQRGSLMSHYGDQGPDKL